MIKLNVNFGFYSACAIRLIEREKKRKKEKREKEEKKARRFHCMVRSIYSRFTVPGVAYLGISLSNGERLQDLKEQLQKYGLPMNRKQKNKKRVGVLKGVVAGVFV